MDDDIPTPTPAPGVRQRSLRSLRRQAWRIPGTLALAGGVFALVTAAAGSDAHDISDARPIDFAEECDSEGCSREEVRELWATFSHECFTEGCWMEEVAENAGGSIYYDPSYGWLYENNGAVLRMFEYFTREFGANLVGWYPKDGFTPSWPG